MPPEQEIPWPSINIDQMHDPEKPVHGDGPSNPKPSRILKFAEVFDLRTYTTKLVKIGKPDKSLDKKKPILVERRIINHKGIHTHTEVDVKSRALCNLLIEINKDVDGLSLAKEPPFADPALFFHSRSALQERLSKEKEVKDPDSALLADISTALQYLDEHHGNNATSLDNLTSQREITWDLLWALFAPNTMMYHFHEFTEQPQVLLMKTMQVRYHLDNTPYWHVDCDMIADDGLKFGFTKKLGITPKPDGMGKQFDIEIDRFDGAKKIQELPVYPMKYVENEAALRLELIERGKKYVRMTGHTFWETNGKAMRETRNEDWETNRFKISTFGRAIVDANAFRFYNGSWACVPTVYATFDRTKLTDNQYLICAPYALGFCFGNKMWGGLAVSGLHAVAWNDEAFQSLMIGAKQKTLIHSLVKQHTEKDSGFDDVIEGKGKGLIGLLSGGPGCGKTLTVEAVSEITKRPLYMASAGELGTNVENIDTKLNLILELSQRWNAILLLDEADVFLQGRDTKDIKRNAIVSIFLRQLEYFQGILFLTTNRIGDFDPAFESRIHFSINYPDLDSNARLSIWRLFIRRTQSGGGPASVIDEKDIDGLAMLENNGRQIKNIVASASSIAKANSESLNVSHIRTVLDVAEAWNASKTSQHFSDK